MWRRRWKEEEEEKEKEKEGRGERGARRGRYRVEEGVALEAAEEHARRDGEEAGAAAPLRLEANRVPHRVPDLLAPLRGDALAHADGADPAGLRHEHVGEGPAAAVDHGVEHQLGHLRGCREAAARGGRVRSGRPEGAKGQAPAARARW